MTGVAPGRAPDEPDLRSVMRLFPTGVAVLSAGRDDGAVATTVNSLTSITLAPPTVMVSLRSNSRAHAAVAATREFCLSFLSDRQAEHARTFASSGKPTGHALTEYFKVNDLGHLLLEGSLATLHCVVTAAYPEGDHSMLLGRVTATYPGETTQGALVFHQGRIGYDSNAVTTRAIRGGVHVDSDSRDDIAAATVDLVDAVMERNGLRADDIEALFFTMTPDLSADIPPLVLRERHHVDVPCLCTVEPHWDGEMPRMIRLLALVHRGRSAPVHHVYLNGAAATRP